MADTVKVKPTPIQRNEFDVAMELFNYHINNYPTTEEEVETVFAKYYSLAKYLSNNSGSKLESLVDEDIVSKVGSLKSSSSW
ncbi:hypothetical protein [Rossellomorea sp. DA94]|uniref:hypothetical protein n=1 Tax=Rossellomorea sp. DA94 TaxID=3038653 RepID=UPI0024472CB0|nr:hypothetical protein [Rossellomorea sp. DA94]WGG47669.1 hypothetical protein P8596_10865 [Rossellomorea sp. DA94]